MWTYTHAETGTKMTASSFENLLIKAKAWHRTNNFPIPHDFGQIIAEQICAVAPDFCYSTEPPTLAEKLRTVAAAMKNWIRQRAPIASAEVILERQSICESCELFGGVRSVGFVSCGRCGCTGLKVYLATEKCPLPEPRWKAVA